MSDLLSKFDPMEFVILVAVSGGLLIGLLSAVAGIIGAYWECVREKQITSSLVQDMLDRGVPTDPAKLAEWLARNQKRDPDRGNHGAVSHCIALVVLVCGAIVGLVQRLRTKSAGPNR